MPKFSVGDYAKVKYVRKFQTECWKEGAIVRIEKVDFGTVDYDGYRYDYVVSMDNGECAFPVEDQLEIAGGTFTVWNTTTVAIDPKKECIAGNF